MGYYSDITGEVVIVGLFLNDLEKYQITTEKCGPDLEVFCKNERSGFYMEPPEPSGFRVDDDPPVITLYPRNEPDKGYGFTEFAEAIYRIWKDGHVKSAEMRRIGASGDDVEHYYLWEGKWKTVQTIEKTLKWRPKLCLR